MRPLLAVWLFAGVVCGDGRAGEADAVVPSPPTVAPCLDTAPAPVVECAAETPSGPRCWADVDYVLWWLREGRLPPTLTTSSPASRGLLGQKDTAILYGDDRLETRHGDRFNGIRVTLGGWLDAGQNVGIEGNFFFLERDSTYFKAVSDGSTLLARPYFTPDGSPASALIAGPTRSGGFVGYSRVELFGQELNLIASLHADDTLRLDLLGGARFLQLRDRTDLTASGQSLDGSTVYGLEDHYRTSNAYYGGQLGLRGQWTPDRWILRLQGTVGLGGNDEEIRAFGQQIVQTAAGRSATPTGLTVQPSNTGTFERASLNLVTEVGVHVGYRLTRHLTAYAGYNFLLWDGPVRSGDQVELVVNRQAGTGPTIPFKEDLFWAQGVTAGCEFSW